MYAIFIAFYRLHIILEIGLFEVNPSNGRIIII
jgi:hypothetical protein